jgi:hypothetical protein
MEGESRDMNHLDDMFKSVSFAGAEDLPKDHHGLPVVIDDEEDNSRLAWEEEIVPDED